MREHSVLRVVAKILTPAILMFALYIQAHGDLSAGGGFQAGVIFATAFVLYALVFGVAQARRAAPVVLVECGMALGLLLFAGVGVASLFAGGDYLDYDVLRHDPVHGQHLGILLVELGVGLTVASTMVAVFFTFADVRPGGDETGAAPGGPGSR